MTPEYEPTDHEAACQEEVPYSAATNWVTKEDLVSIRPDLAAQIEAESEFGLVDYVAGRVGDALQEVYWEAVNQALQKYFHLAELEADEDRGGSW